MAINKRVLIIFISVILITALLSACNSSNKNTIFPLDENGQTNRNVVLINNTEYSLTPRKDANGEDLDDSATVSDSIDVKTDGETLTVVLPQVSPRHDLACGNRRGYRKTGRKECNR